jgi:hypothetical protein
LTDKIKLRFIMELYKQSLYSSMVLLGLERVLDLFSIVFLILRYDSFSPPHVQGDPINKGHFKMAGVQLIKKVFRKFVYMKM